MASWIALALLAGCQPPAEHLPTYRRLSDVATLQTLAARGREIHSVGGSGTLTLTQPNGQTVRLTLAVALRPPIDARMRTFKFGQPVFDLTIRPDGAWLETPPNSSHAKTIHTAGLSAAKAAQGWALLGGGLFEDNGLSTRDDGNRLIVMRKLPGKPTLVCSVDRDTLTPRLYQLYDNNGKMRFSLTLGDYKDYGGILWPRHIVATSDSGTIDVMLDQVDMNTDLPATAFVPPHRAEKLP